MNLDEIIEGEIYPRLDWNPGLRANRDNIVRLVNGHYLEISDGADWLFLQIQRTLTVRATDSGSATATVQIATGNLRRVVGTGTSFTSDMEGQTFRVTGVTFRPIKSLTLGPIATATSTEATIAWVVSATEMYLSEEATAAVPAATTTWSVRYPRYALPFDCGEVLSIVSRADDRGKLTFIDRRKEAIAFLDVDSTGDPSVAVEDDHIGLRAPDSTPTLTTATTGGDFPASTTYEVCYTLLEAGRESPPSLVASVATGATATNTITVANLEDSRWADSVPDRFASGTRCAVYVREQTAGGRWRRYVTMRDTEVSGASVAKGSVTLLKVLPDTIGSSFTFSVGHTAVTGITYSTRDDQERLLDANPRPYLRFWTTPDADLDLALRYRVRPVPLSHDADVPRWPQPYHPLLVFRVMAELCTTYGQNTASAVYQRRADDLLKQMRSKYLSRTDREYVRRGFSALNWRWRYGDPTYT